MTQEQYNPKTSLLHREKTGSAVLQAFLKDPTNGTAIIKVFVEQNQLDESALTDELETTVGDLLGDVLHALRMQQFPNAEGPVQLSRLDLTTFLAIQDLLGDLVADANGIHDDFLERNKANFLEEQEDALSLIPKYFTGELGQAADSHFDTLVDAESHALSLTKNDPVLTIAIYSKEQTQDESLTLIALAVEGVLFERRSPNRVSDKVARFGKLMGMFSLPEQSTDTGYFYHALSSEQWQKVQNSGHLSAGTYFGVMEIADYYREDIEDNGETPVVLKVPYAAFDPNMMEIDRPGIDEPVCYSAFGKKEEDVAREWEDSDQTVNDCIEIIGSFRYKASIPLSLILVDG